MYDEDELVRRLREPCQYENCILCQQAADAIEELICEVADEHNARLDAEERHRWIPVGERLPEKAGEYLVCGRWRGKQTKIWVCEFITLGYMKGWANNAENPVVSHWMPLPQKPKEE